jgi:hypothetical protein
VIKREGIKELNRGEGTLQKLFNVQLNTSFKQNELYKKCDHMSDREIMSLCPQIYVLVVCCSSGSAIVSR